MKNQNGISAAMSPLKTNSKKLLLLSLLLCVGMLFSTEMRSQQKPPASLSGAGILQLPTNLPLSNSYEFSIGSFQFSSETVATEYFSNKSYNAFFMRPIVSQGKVILMLELSKHPNWTIAQWNSLLSTQTAASPLTN